MNQSSLFDDIGVSDFDAVKDALKSVVNENWLDPAELEFNERKSYYAASFGDAVFARIPKMKKYKRVEILSPAAVVAGTFVTHEVEQWEDLADLTEEFEAALQAVIDRAPKGFSCCSRYSECSKLHACCHPDYSMRAQCYYRKVLRSGRCFY